jgi:hypothetical protein
MNRTLNSSSNEAFYKNAEERFGTKFKVVPRHRIYKDYLKQFVLAFQMATVVRYHSDSTYLGSTFQPHTGLYREEWYGWQVKRTMSCAWFMQINGFEYFLELVQPAHVDLSTATNAERYNLIGPEWNLKFIPGPLNPAAAGVMLFPRYMNKSCVVNEFEFDGTLESFDCDMTLFGLAKNDLMEISKS